MPTLNLQAVAHEGSITKAAKTLGYVQSNVTARIQQLEVELKTQLFCRQRGMVLTPTGERLLLKFPFNKGNNQLSYKNLIKSTFVNEKMKNMYGVDSMPKTAENLDFKGMTNKMYTQQQRQKALEEYNHIKSVSAVIQHLGYLS